MSNWISGVINRLRGLYPQGKGNSAMGGLRLKDISIRRKLPLAFALLSVTSVVCIMSASLYMTRNSQLESARQAFQLAINARSIQIKTWYENMHSTLVTMSSGKQSIDALYTLSSMYKDLKEEAKSTLQKAYIGGNPHPAGEKMLLDRAAGPELYNAEHAKFHKTFRAMVEQAGLYDMFLIDRDGNIVYTVAKEVDFADNVHSKMMEKSGLAKVYDQAMKGKAGETFLSDFDRYAPSAGAFALFMATPIVSDMGKTVGVLAIQLPEKTIGDIIAKGDKIGESTDIFVVTGQLRALTPSLGKNNFKVGGTVKDLPYIREGLAGNDQTINNVLLQSGEYGSVQTNLIESNGSPWLLVAERDNADILTGFYSELKLQLSIAGIATLLVVAVGVWISRGFATPIGAMNTVIQEVAAGNLDVDIKYTDQKDEIGEIARSLHDMREKLLQAHELDIMRQKDQAAQADVVEKLTQALAHMSNGDLTQTIDRPFAEHYEVLRGYFNQAVHKMSESLSQIAMATEGIRAQTGEISRASEELAHRTEVQAATLEQTAAAMDEMTASVKSAADGVREVEGIVTHARKDADECGIVVTEAVTAMAEIEKSSSQISQIIGVIDDIAFQTNLLALNAGVEAARAGDAGRGFAVVASEVGALAQRASTAAKEIKTLISTSSQQVERGVDRVKEAGSALQQIAKRVTHISTLTTDIATGASEQAIGLNEINVGVTQLDQATQKNAAMAEEANAASQLMASGAEELTHLVGRFKLPRPQGDAAAQIPQRAEFGQMVRPQTASMAGTGATAVHLDLDAEIDLAEPAPAPRPIAANARGVWQDF